MAYTAYVREIELREDVIYIKIEYTNGTDSYYKDYQFNHVNDISVNFRNTILGEVSRINNITDSLNTLRTNWLDREV